jgi:hypothetical protein
MLSAMPDDREKPPDPLPARLLPVVPAAASAAVAAAVVCALLPLVSSRYVGPIGLFLGICCASLLESRLRARQGREAPRRGVWTAIAIALAGTAGALVAMGLLE